jgi:flagellar basal body rod protein FlgC
LTCHLLLPVTTTNQYQTNEADLPEGRSFQAWDRTRIDDWAARVGPSTVTVIGKIFESTSIEEAGYDPDQSESDDGGYVRGSAYYAGGTR